MPLIDLMSKEHGACTAVATHSSTAPLTDFVWETKYGLGKDTPEFANATIDYVQKNRIRHVLLAGIWCGYGNVSESGQTEGKLLVCLKRTIELLRIAGADVTIMLEVPCQNSLATPRILARQSFLRRDVDEIGITRLHHLSRVKETNDQIRDVVGSEATILDPAEYLINQNGFCSAQKNGKSRYRDNHHLTAAGAMELRPLFQPLFDAITETNLEKIENEFPLSNMPRALDR